MEKIKLLEEQLREAACIGDIDGVITLLSNGIDPNARHKINGWTALHWAAKRGHKDIVEILLNHKADKSILTEKGESPLSLTTRSDIYLLLEGEGVSPANPEPNLAITPNYLKNQPLNGKVDIYVSNGMSRRKTNSNVESVSNQTNNSHNTNSSTSEELVLKVRVANSGDPDFIEVELPQAELTYYTLLRVCCDELGLSASQVVRIRKLPDTMIRKDKDVQRLSNFQEIELVVPSQAKSLPPGTTNNGYQSIHLYKNQTILY
uniref:Uncharacterized protein n=1 Tax=Clastoptera arizonana TaxID=38151 RepID=A0A1B6EFF4_9HEMI